MVAQVSYSLSVPSLQDTRMSCCILELQKQQRGDSCAEETACMHADKAQDVLEALGRRAMVIMLDADTVCPFILYSRCALQKPNDPALQCLELRPLHGVILDNVAV